MNKQPAQNRMVDDGQEVAAHSAEALGRLPADYYHETLVETANTLELLSGSRQMRLYLSQPWYYGSEAPEVLAVAYVRGLEGPALLRRPMWLERRYLKRGGTENRFPLAADTAPGKAYLTGSATRSSHPDPLDPLSPALARAGVGFSLYLPISDGDAEVGVAALDFERIPAEGELDSIEQRAGEFLRRTAAHLRAVNEYRYEKILRERLIDRALRRQRAYLLLRNLVKTGPADLAAFLARDPYLLVGTRRGPSSPPELGEESVFLIEAYSQVRRDKFHLRDALIALQPPNLPCVTVRTETLSEIGASSDGHLPRPTAESLVREPKPVAAAWLRDVLPAYTHFLSYPLFEDAEGRLLGIVLLFLTEETMSHLTKDRGTPAFELFPNLHSVVEGLKSTLVEPVGDNLVLERLLAINTLSRGYERFDGMKNIQEALSLYLHEALTQLAGLADADYGTVGLVTTLGTRPYLVVQKDTGAVVGAKVGALQEIFLPPLPIGAPARLLSSEYSLSGVAAGTGETAIADDLGDLNHAGLRREFPPDVRSAIAIPIDDAAGRTVAVLTLSSTRRRHFTSQSQAILESMTSLLAEPIDRLIKKHSVAEASLQLYGGRYPYIDNEALRVLGAHYQAGDIRLAPFMDEILVTRSRRLAENPASSTHVIRDDVERTFWQMNIDVQDLQEYISRADREIAESLYRLLKERRVTFQEGVQKAYTEHRISREVVRTLIDLAKEEMEKPQITKVAALLNVCSPDYRGRPEERKKIEQFRQFYYRTVGLET